MDKKSFLTIFLAAVLFFVISAGASYMWRYWKDKDTVADGAPSSMASESPEPSSPPVKAAPEVPDTEGEFDVPVAVRVRSDVPGAEEKAELAVNRRSGLDDIEQQKKQLKEKAEETDLIYNDILEAQRKVDDLRQQVDDELAEHTKTVERYFAKMQVTGEPDTEPEGIGASGGGAGTDVALSGIEAKRILKRMAAEYDTMSPESVAAIFRQLIKGGNTDTVVSLIDEMKERQVGSVMDQFKETDPGLAASLTERRLQATQQPAEPTTTSP